MRTISEAITRARLQSKNGPALPAVGMCAKAVRLCFDAPSSGDADGDGDADAVDVFRRAGRDVIPLNISTLAHAGKLERGLPLVFAGGGHGYGHIVIPTGHGVGLNSLVWSTDVTRLRYFDRVTVARIIDWMTNPSILGQVRSLGGQRITR